MPIALYMDVHIPRAITTGLLLLDVDVITAQEAKANNLFFFTTLMGIDLQS